MQQSVTLFIIQTNKSTTYTVYIHNVSYIVSTPTCFSAPALSSESLILLLC